MAVPQAVQSVYDQSLVLVKAVQAIAGSTVQRWASTNDYLFKERIKTADSIAEKLESGRFRAWRDLDDLYACMVVVPTTSHIEATFQFLQSAFETFEIRGQGVGQKAPELFRFDSARFIGLLKEQPESERPRGVESVLFEVQILTAFEYAWSIATHDLVFKGPLVDWRRDRLAAHLRATAEEADILITSFEETAGAIRVSPHDDTERRERIIEFFRTAVEDARLAPTLEPTSWVRFGQNVVALIRSTRSATVDEVIDTLLEESRRALESGPSPTSGSLFQFVIGVLARTNGENALRRFVIVDSSELRDLYSVMSVPRRFDFGALAEE